ncbi:MAG: fumarylacetoacetate hydrolase family protein, partial [Chloroflexi bacterium]|nr:fumarylacetoacetate hydrolase family protein [Chloroflexota bacterium]
MKLAVFGPERRVGVVSGNQIVDANRACARFLRDRQNEPRPWAMANALAPADLGQFVQAGPRAIETAQQAVDYALTEAGDDRTGRLIVGLNEVRLHAPMPSGVGRICCAGGNFAKHTANLARASRGEDISDEEMFKRTRGGGMWGFWKVAHEVGGTGDAVPYPSRTERFDYEGEVAVIVGHRGKDWTEAEAREAIWGVTLLNDWSIRDNAGPQRPMSFNFMKNFDGCATMGPFVVVGELDPQNIQVKTTVNGQPRQNYNTSEMVFSFAEYLAFVSTDLTMVPGDVLSGGTGAGTAMDSSKYVEGKSLPDLFLKPGDEVEISAGEL